MSKMNKLISGSIIGLKKEFEDRYIALHKHTFPEVLHRIHSANISDYSIFLSGGILFSHMVYTGDDFAADMDSIAQDEVTQDWWKLTDPMQQPLEPRKKNEWWAAADLWYNFMSETPGVISAFRYAFTFALPADMPESAPDDLFGDIHFWGTTYLLKCLNIFKSIDSVYLYIETSGPSDISFLLEIITRVINSDSAATEMKEVFHTDSEMQPLNTSPKKVFVTGCFDLLHSGHIAFLQQAAGYGDLYVSIGSDANVHQLKGRYPVNTQDERIYMLNALACVKKCMVNSGWGYIDFEKEILDVKPDIFVVNEDGHTPAKQAFCRESGIEYHILKRIPHADLPVRSTTTLRTLCTIPFRIDLAGGWLDQPFVSKHYPGSVLTISIEPTIEFNDRSGMSSSTRRKAIELWKNEIPQGDNEHLAKLLFAFENPPGSLNVSGSQDSLGIVLSGLNKLDYNGGYWPESIVSEHDENLLTWIEEKLFLVTLGPRVNSYSPLVNTNINPAGAKALSEAASDCWNAIQKKDIVAFGLAFTRSFEAQIAMFPNMVDEEIMKTIGLFKDKALGWKLSGAGGGGYIILIADTAVEGAIKIRIRRKNSL